MHSLKVVCRYVKQASARHMRNTITQPPIQWVPGVLNPRVKRGRVVMLTTHPHLVPRSKMRSYTPSLVAYMAVAGQLLPYDFRHVLHRFVTQPVHKRNCHSEMIL
jgi:hypothetical protein